MAKVANSTSAEVGPYIDAYNEAVEVHLRLDLKAWGELLSLKDRVLFAAWAGTLVDTGQIQVVDVRRF